MQIRGTLPPELWNRLGTKLVPKLRAGKELTVGLNISVTIGSEAAAPFESDVNDILEDLGLGDRIRIDKEMDPRK